MLYILFDRLKKMDYILIGLLVLIVLYGLMMIYSSTYDTFNNDLFTNDSLKQVVWFLIGIVFFIVLSLVNHRRVLDLSLFIYIVGVLLLAYVLLNGYISKGSSRWIRIGAINLQPSEIFKFGYIVTIGWIMRNYQGGSLGYFNLAKYGILLMVPFLLIVLQPDLGTALIYVAIFGGLVLVLGVKLRTFIISIILGAIMLPVSFFVFLHDYQRVRVLSFFSPDQALAGSNYQVVQSKIAVGSGGIFGKGYLQGTQTHLKFIPESHTDFIFAITAEELGLIGGMLVLFILLGIIHRVFLTAIAARETAAKVICISVGIAIFFQLFINVSMVLGVAPVVGIPIPFFSYGGSSLLTLFCFMGLVNSIHIDSKSNRE